MFLQTLLAKKGILGSVATLLYGGGGGGITGGALGFNKNNAYLADITIDEDVEEVSNTTSSQPGVNTKVTQNIEPKVDTVPPTKPEPLTTQKDTSPDASEPATIQSEPKNIQAPSAVSKVPEPTQQVTQPQSTPALVSDVQDPTANVALSSPAPSASSTTSSPVVASPSPQPLPIQNSQSTNVDTKVVTPPPAAPKATVKKSGPKFPYDIESSPLYSKVKNSEDIEKNINGVFCSNEVFKENINLTEKEKRNNDLTQKPELKTGVLNGCLTVLGYKAHYGGNKGKGAGRFIGTARSGNYATMFVSTLETENGKLIIDGSAYVFTTKEVDDSNVDEPKEGNNIAWHATSGRKEVTSENKNKFVFLPGNKIIGYKGDGGFTFDNTDVCKDGECNSEYPEKYTEYKQAGTLSGGKDAAGVEIKFEELIGNQDIGGDDGLFPKYVTDNYTNTIFLLKKHTPTRTTKKLI